ncbi:MAG: plastocyanin/azurin family copper-binding protein [Actinomycetota bacterium]
MRRLPFLVGLLTATLGGAPATGAAHARSRSAPPSVQVEVSDFQFDPTAVPIGAGQTVVFDFVGPSHHTVTDASGMALYESGSVGPGDPSFSVTYPAAGAYLFTCIPHPWMGGRVTIPMRVHRVTGDPAPTFRVGWAASDAAVGFVYDVQITRPGRHWTAWQTDVTIRGMSFTPTAGPGTYRLRARMRSVGGGQALWSPAVELHIG